MESVTLIRRPPMVCYDSPAAVVSGAPSAAEGDGNLLRAPATIHEQL